MPRRITTRVSTGGLVDDAIREVVVDGAPLAAAVADPLRNTVLVGELTCDADLLLFFPRARWVLSTRGFISHLSGAVAQQVVQPEDLLEVGPVSRLADLRQAGSGQLSATQNTVAPGMQCLFYSGADGWQPRLNLPAVGYDLEAPESGNLFWRLRSAAGPALRLSWLVGMQRVPTRTVGTLEADALARAELGLQRLPDGPAWSFLPAVSSPAGRPVSGSSLPELFGPTMVTLSEDGLLDWQAGRFGLSAVPLQLWLSILRYVRIGMSVAAWRTYRPDPDPDLRQIYTVFARHCDVSMLDAELSHFSERPVLPVGQLTFAPTAPSGIGDMTIVWIYRCGVGEAAGWQRIGSVLVATDPSGRRRTLSTADWYQLLRGLAAGDPERRRRAAGPAPKTPLARRRVASL